MDKKFVKKAVIFVLALFLLISAAGCAQQSQQAGGQAAGEQSTFTVTDQAGRTVEIPKEVKSIATTWGPATTLILPLGKGNLITGVNINTKSELALKAAPNIQNAVSVGRGIPDMEAMAKLKPDVYFHKANDVQTLDAVQKLGIAAVGVYSEDPESMVKATELIGKVLGAEEQASKLIAFYNSKLEFANNLVKAIPEKERKTAIVMGGDIGKVANGGMIQSYIIEFAGGINPAKDLDTTELWPTVGTEQIFEWNPDFIFFVYSSQATYTVEEFMKDPAMAKLKAVKNKNVLMIPSEQDPWDFPGIQSALGTLWVLNQLYPELYSAESLQKDINEYYQLAYGMTFDRDWLGY